MTLAGLFGLYRAEVTPTKSRRTQWHDRMAMDMFLEFFGRDRPPATLSKRDWDRFILARRRGKVGRSGKPVSDRTVESDLMLLRAVLNWAAKSRGEDGEQLLRSNPLRGLKLPVEKNPNRVLLGQDEYEALLQASRRVGRRFRLALVLAHETGHRIGAIRHLQWSDIDFADASILWRAKHEKTGYEHRTPATAAAIGALREEWERRSRPEGGPVIPASSDPAKCAGSSTLRWWFNRAEELAGLEPRRGRGWHSLRRKFASDLIDQPLKVLCQLGGWRDADTVLRCYQRPDADRLRQALESRRQAS